MKYLKAFLITLILLHPCFAHHAMEYIEMESFSTARKGELILHIHYDYMVENYKDPLMDHWEFTPGFSYGLTDRFMFDIHTHFAKFGNHLVENKYQDRYDPYGPSPFMEAFALALQYEVTRDFPVNVAVAILYEYPFKRSRDLLDGRQVFEGTLILSKNFLEHSNFSFNLKYGKDGDEFYTDWALGVKTPLTSDSHGINAGVEFLGSFKDFKENFSILPGVYLPVGAENVVLKTGIEFGPASDSMRANLTLMCRF